MEPLLSPQHCNLTPKSREQCILQCNTRARKHLLHPERERLLAHRHMQFYLTNEQLFVTVSELSRSLNVPVPVSDWAKVFILCECSNFNTHEKFNTHLQSYIFTSLAFNECTRPHCPVVNASNMLVFKVSSFKVSLMDISDQGDKALYLHPKCHCIWAKVFLSQTPFTSLQNNRMTFAFHLCLSTAGCSPPSVSSIVSCLLLSCSRLFPPSLLRRLAIFCMVVLLSSSLSLVATLCSVWPTYCPTFLLYVRPISTFVSVCILQCQLFFFS